MRIVYMGTPDFAVPSLTALAEAGHDVIYVVTQPDAVQGRGKKVHFPPVKEKALELGIEVLQPQKIKKNEEFRACMEAASPDMIVVAAYGKILPKWLLDLPEKGCINVHGSLLPRFRGAAPIQAAIASGDEETGITIMQMAEGLDTGDMLAKASTPIDSKNGEELHDELAQLGADLLIETIGRIDEIIPEKQDDSLSTYAPMIFKKDGHIDFTLDPQRVERTMRAYDPWPGTYAYNGDVMIKFWKAEALDQPCSETPGTVVAVSPDGIDISCGGQILRATVIQMPGKRRVPVKEFLKGNAIEIGTVLG